ncbi:cobalt ECF transporter T component CbiQ [Spirulina subsalsa FACHB-351]|uniref:Cobalt ECF transporter T component CbiQ n=1 Tax=Spirulina subsalsa FACHB-351 TaxID=234711 RepID=A0ABT3L623_9CYAN|nr:cobalt ECF transporter T component CbiQ [Spirulina subsalsa FACHB-351]
MDRYAHLKSPVHRWQHPPKLLGLLSLIFTFAGVERLQLLPLMVGVTAGLYALSRLPFSFLWGHLRYPGLFIAGVVVFLPLVQGETVIVQWGAVAVRWEGCLTVVLIVTRFVCIVTVSLVLFGTAPFVSSLKAMRSLGLPKLLVDMALLTYRYLEELAEMRLRMQRAMTLRGFRGDRLTKRNLERLADLVGTLLVRSYEQSQRVYQAMILRGYGQPTTEQDQTWQGIHAYSWWGLVLTLVIACSFWIAPLVL